MAYRFKTKLKWSDVTPKADYLNRRKLMAGAGAMVLGAGAARAFSSRVEVEPEQEPAKIVRAKLKTVPSAFSTDEKPNSREEISSYNNFYEFGTSKSDPSRNAGGLMTDPWSITIDGLVDKPGSYDLAELVQGIELEERIYRLRCVEAWSMVVPWAGFELGRILERVGVQSGAKYVAFETLVRPSEMPGQRSRVIDWPYREGLRLDEAMHPLTILATGIYGETIPNQCGAPIRLVVPWKYGFKSIKSIVRISLTDKQPKTTWNEIGPNEYGFYANVNPEVDHPRWSQASERRIGDGVFAKRRDTLPFNGYGEEVASLYKGMDLRKFY